MADAVARSGGLGLADATTIADDALLASEIVRAFTDAAVLGDAAQTAAETVRALSDTGHPRRRSDPDISTGRTPHTVSIDDTLELADARSQAAGLGVADTADAADVALAVSDMARAVAHTVDASRLARTRLLLPLPRAITDAVWPPLTRRCFNGAA